MFRLYIFRIIKCAAPHASESSHSIESMAATDEDHRGLLRLAALHVLESFGIERVERGALDFCVDYIERCERLRLLVVQFAHMKKTHPDNLQYFVAKQI